MFKVCYEVPLPPSVAARLPSLQPFDSVVMRALARDPQERFANAAEFLAALLEAQASSGRANNTDETIIQSGGGTAGGATSQSASPSGIGAINGSSGPPASTNTLVGAGWNLEALAEIEKRLARYVGPIAKVVVRRAAREARDIVQLTHILADKIPKTAHREEFLKGVGVLAANPENTLPRIASQSATAGQLNGAAYGTGSQRLLTPDDVSRATRLLMAQMGPIAPVLAKRAAKPGATREQFIAALASYLKDDAARSRFLDALR
jgi:serine/threonine-protein kinase